MDQVLWADINNFKSKTITQTDIVSKFQFHTDQLEKYKKTLMTLKEKLKYLK